MKMRRNLTTYALCASLVGLAGLGITACGSKQQVDDAAVARDADWKLIQKMHDELEQKREQLAALTAAPAAEPAAGEPAAGEPATGEKAAGSDDPIAAQQKEVDQLTQDLGDRLVSFINDNPPIVGEPLTEVQAAAVRMKSHEDMYAASEYIDKGGDYRRAIDIYQTALKVDPDYPELKDALAKAEEMRFVTEERFSGVKKGMTEPEVRAVLGPVNVRNVRHFDKDNVTAWYYAKDEQGAAAAVWFRPDKKKGLVVYQAQFNAIGDEAGSGAK
jgi:tetratricopeptide (TPR) repeat protein